MQKKILIADDHYVVRMGASLLLHSAYEDLEIDFTESYTDAKAKISDGNYDLVMLDIDMPGSINMDMITELKISKPDIKIMIFSAYDEKTAIQYINRGADGYLNKQQSEKVVEAVTSIFEQGYYYPQEITHYIVNNIKDTTAVSKLSKRELEIFILFAEGNGNLEISNSLNIKMSTVSTFKKRIYEKLEVKSIVELIKLHEKYRLEVK